MTKPFAKKVKAMPGLDASLVVQYENDYDFLFQQMQSRLQGMVRMKTGVVGTMTGFMQLGGSDPTDITGIRHGTTPWHDSPTFRRWAVKRDYEDPQMLDEEDALEMLVDIEMGYARNAVSGMNRKMDKVIIDAATGTAVSGATGTSTSAFNTAAPTSDGGGGNQIAVAASGLTIDKMRFARAIFDVREVGIDDMEGGVMAPFVWIMSAANHQDLLEQTEATSTDYIGVEIVNGTERQSRMPLVRGRIQTYMGFQLKISGQLNMSGTDFVNVAFHKDAMGLAIWGGRRIWLGDLPEHNLARGIIVKEHFGAVRIQDAGVLAIVCNP